MTELKFEDMTAAASGDSQNMLGKLLYFSLPSVLVDKNDLRRLCADMNIPYAGGNRLSVSDAFRSATGDAGQDHQRGIRRAPYLSDLLPG